MGYKKWRMASCDKAIARELAEECGTDAFTALLMTARGITDPMDAEAFLSDEADLSSPYDLVDMDKAVERIRRAVDSGERIAVYGDYDADGVTATALLYQCLCDLGADAVYSLPTREGDGYGMHEGAVRRLKEQGVSLIVTVDNGIAACDEVAFASALGMDVVVTDHHLPGETLPPAVAVVDSHRTDCPSTFKDYAGVGVAFLLAAALSDCACEELIDQYGDLVCIGTVADVMPLLSDNRMMVRRGLAVLNTAPRPGIAALLEVSALRGREITASSVAFGLGPRINAAGRVGDPHRALRLLLTQDKDEATALAGELAQDNVRRKELEQAILKEISEMLRADPRPLTQPVLVLAGEGWHHGVLGIIAARMTEQYSRPSIVFSVDGTVATGSARSYAGVSMYELLSGASEETIRFGGHESAAGVTVETEKLEAFTAAVVRTAETLYPLMPYCEQMIDCKLNPKSLSVGVVYAHRQLEPFGAANPEPLYGLFGMRVSQISGVGAGKHTRLLLTRDGVRVPAVWFSMPPQKFGYAVGDTVDLAVSLDISVFNNTESLSVVVRGCKPSQLDYDTFLGDRRRLEVARRTGAPIPCPAPTRDEFARVYRQLRAAGGAVLLDELLPLRFGIPYLTAKAILLIMEELRLVTLEEDGGCVTVRLCEMQEKVNLEASGILADMKGQR